MLRFYKNKKIFITGHTGFKGTWLCKILIDAGAHVTGYSLEPFSNPNLFKLSGIENDMNSIIGDIRDYSNLKIQFDLLKPEIVIHLAAQPLVRESYIDPLLTYNTNVMGTVNILECIRNSDYVKSFLNITTDKVYQNNEWEWGYRENDPLNGYDPYSNSKSCSDIITQTYKKAFFDERNIAASTARAGNVIGGGDFAKDRIIPDCIRSIEKNTSITIRNPHSIRPYQHVLEPLFAYLLIVNKQYNNTKFAGCYNVGPKDEDCVNTGKLVDLFCYKWEKLSKTKVSWSKSNNLGPHEANFLKLDCSKMKMIFDWKPRWDIDTAIEKTVEWTKAYFENDNIPKIMKKQIEEYKLCCLKNGE